MELANSATCDLRMEHGYLVGDGSASSVNYSSIRLLPPLDRCFKANCRMGTTGRLRPLGRQSLPKTSLTSAASGSTMSKIISSSLMMSPVCPKIIWGVCQRSHGLSMGQLCHVRDVWSSILATQPHLNRLSNAKRIILLGHGPGVVAVSELLNHRSISACYASHSSF